MTSGDSASRVIFLTEFRRNAPRPTAGKLFRLNWATHGLSKGGPGGDGGGGGGGGAPPPHMASNNDFSLFIGAPSHGGTP